MTPRQRDCLEAIRAHWRAYGEAPTRAELGRALGITAVSAHLLVRGLARVGAVCVVPRVHRNVEAT
jgi:Mn-dependent DtxR family transcriptional regulator